MACQTLFLRRMILLQGSLFSRSVALRAGSVRRHVFMQIIRRDQRRFLARREKEEAEKYGQGESDECQCIFHSNLSLLQNSRVKTQYSQFMIMVDFTYLITDDHFLLFIPRSVEPIAISSVCIDIRDLAFAFSCTCAFSSEAKWLVLLFVHLSRKSSPV